MHRSFEVEVQFYRLAPALAQSFKLLTRRLQLWLLVAAMLFCWLASTAVEGMSYGVRMLLPFHPT